MPLPKCGIRGCEREIHEHAYVVVTIAGVDEPVGGALGLCLRHWDGFFEATTGEKEHAGPNE